MMMKHTTALPICLALAGLAMPLANASAISVFCHASGANAQGPFSYLSVVVDVGPAAPARLSKIEDLLHTYVTKQQADARDVHAQCDASDDSGAVTVKYTLAVNAASRQQGWDHVKILRPEDWLPAEDILDSSTHP
jgi:hypothetical protein